MTDDWSHVESDPDSYTLQEQKRIACSILPVIFERYEETRKVFAEHEYFVDTVHFDADEKGDDQHHYRGQVELYTDVADDRFERLNAALACFAPCFTHIASFSAKSELRREILCNHMSVVMPEGCVTWHVRLAIQLTKSRYHSYLALGT